jgi:hypothetical protein
MFPVQYGFEYQTSQVHIGMVNFSWNRAKQRQMSHTYFNLEKKKTANLQVWQSRPSVSGKRKGSWYLNQLHCKPHLQHSEACKTVNQLLGQLCQNIISKDKVTITRLY